MKPITFEEGFSASYFPQQDLKLFQDMDGKYISKEEEEFFDVMQEKILHDFSWSGDYLLHEEENDDLLYWLKDYWYEHRMGRMIKKGDDVDFVEAHFDSLYDLLTCNLKEKIGFYRDITFWQWLRENNYKYLHYDWSWGD